MIEKEERERKIINKNYDFDWFLCVWVRKIVAIVPRMKWAKEILNQIGFFNNRLLRFYVCVVGVFYFVLMRSVMKRYCNWSNKYIFPIEATWKVKHALRNLVMIAGQLQLIAALLSSLKDVMQKSYRPL